MEITYQVRKKKGFKYNSLASTGFEALIFAQACYTFNFLSPSSSAVKEGDEGSEHGERGRLSPRSKQSEAIMMFN